MTNRDARLDVFVVWLNLYTMGASCIDILRDRHSWLPVFLPAFDEGPVVTVGTRIEMRITRALSVNQRNPDFDLEGRIKFVDGTVRSFRHASHHIAPGFRQNRFYQALFSGEDNQRNEEERLVAYVVANSAARDVCTISEQLENEAVSEWSRLYDGGIAADVQDEYDFTCEAARW